MKIIKRLFIALIVVGVLFVAAGYAASKYINKEMVEKQISEATGREFKIEGELKPVFSLTPSVKAEKVSMANAAWGSKSKLASIGSFEVKVQLLPLLSKKIVIDKVIIDGADISLEKKGGKWNFDFEKVAAKNEGEKDKPVADKKPMSFDISGLSITNSHLVVNQDGKPMVVDVKVLKFAPHESKMGLDFEGVVDKKPLKVSANLPPIADLMGAKKVDVANLVIVSEDLKISANVSADMGTKKAEIKNIDVLKGDLKVSAKGNADIDAKKINLSSVSIVKGDIKLNGALSVDAGGKKPYLRGNLSADSIIMPVKQGSGSGGESGGKSAGGAMFSDEPLPFDAFDAANADVALKIGKLKSGDLVVENINTNVKLNNGVLALAPLNAGFANGQIASNITLSKAATHIALKASNIELEKLVGDLKNGKTDADINLSGSGNSLAKIAGSLSGTSKITVGKATYSGEILKGRAAQFSNLLYGNSGGHTLEINCVLADIIWAGGTGSLQQAGVDTKYANVGGTGRIRLANESLNLVLTPVSKLAALNNLAVPIGVGGTFNSPQVSPMTQKVVENVGKNVLDNFLAAKKSGGKFKLNAKTALGIQKGATITSPCRAAPVTVPAETPATTPVTNEPVATPPNAPAAEQPAAAATEAQKPAATSAAPAAEETKAERKERKRDEKIQAIGSGLKALGL